VTVKNQGTAPAGPSTTQVDFFQYGQISLPTPPLGAGQLTSPLLAFPIPPGCGDPDCEFRITVDVNNDVAESNEANNTADGICIG
jgi:subtilase family serine protease